MTAKYSLDDQLRDAAITHEVANEFQEIEQELRETKGRLDRLGAHYIRAIEVHTEQMRLKTEQCSQLVAILDDLTMCAEQAANQNEAGLLVSDNAWQELRNSAGRARLLLSNVAWRSAMESQP